MKILKQMIFLIAAMAFLAIPAGMAAGAAVPGVDTSQKVYDFAGILSSDEEARLAGATQKAISDRGVDFVILTVEDDLGLGMVRFSDEFYEQNGFGGESFYGVMLYVNMTERDVYIATYGDDIVGMFSSGDIDAILDEVAPLLSGGSYYAACDRFITAASSHILYKRNRDLGVGFVISLVAGAAVPLIMLMLHSRTLSPRPGINTYFSGHGFTLTNSRDDFLSTNTTRTPIPQNNNSGGSRGGGGAHTTSGGHSAGGGGRKF